MNVKDLSESIRSWEKVFDVLDIFFVNVEQIQKQK